MQAPTPKDTIFREGTAQLYRFRPASGSPDSAEPGSNERSGRGRCRLRRGEAGRQGEALDFGGPCAGAKIAGAEPCACKDNVQYGQNR